MWQSIPPILDEDAPEPDLLVATFYDLYMPQKDHYQIIQVAMTSAYNLVQNPPKDNQTSVIQ